MAGRLFACCFLLGVAVFSYPVFVAPAPATLALAGCALALLLLGLLTSRWLGAGLAAGLATFNYALALSLGGAQPDTYAPALAVASWLLLELFDLAVMSRTQAGIDAAVYDTHRRRLIRTSGAAGLAGVGVLLAGIVWQVHPALLPAAATAGAAVVMSAVSLTRRVAR